MNLFIKNNNFYNNVPQIMRYLINQYVTKEKRIETCTNVF